MKNRWYDCSVDELTEKLDTDKRSGLSSKEALTRLRASGKNIIYPISKASFKSYLKHVVTDLTTILLILTAAAAALVEKNASALVILGILAVNSTVSILSFVRSQRILEDAAGQSLPNAKVIRDGKLFMIRQEELVRGDIILVSAGDIVPCDARLVEEDGLVLLESNLTDSPGAAKKRADFVDARNLPVRERVNMLYASTIVTQGRGRAIVCETGASTLVCVMKRNPSIANHDKLNVIARLQKYSNVGSLISIGLVFVFTLLNFYFSTGRGIFDVFLMTLSQAVASMSELYTAFAYIVISVGIFGAIRQYRFWNTGAVIKNASAIERMKKLDCILVPKQSLFLEKEMKLSYVYVDGNMYSVFSPRPYPAAVETLRYALISTGLYGAGKLVSNNVSANNVYTPEEETIIRASRQCSLYNKRLDNEFPLVEHVGFTRESRFATTLFRHDGGYRLALRGDPKQILANCTSYKKDGVTMAMTIQKKSEILFEASRLMRENYRVVAVATRPSPYNNLRRLAACQNDLTFEGYICIEEPILPDAAKNIARCRNAGIRVIMFSHDISESNRCLGKALGIIRNDEDAVSIAQLSQMKDDLIRTNLPIYNLYEGLSNAQLRHIMGWLKADLGYEIGVLGRTLDDIGLIREADVGFAEVITLSGNTAKGGVQYTEENLPMLAKNSKDSGRNGCEALKFISDVALSKPDRYGNGGFNALVAAISSAKIIYQNIYNTVNYLLLTNVARLFFVLMATFTDTVLMKPHQMLFTGLIMDLLAVFVIAFSRPDPLGISDTSDYEKKLKTLFWREIPTMFIGVLWGLSSLVSAKIGTMYLSDFGAEAQNTLVFASFIICQTMILLSVTNPGVLSGKGIRIHLIYVIDVLVCAGFLVSVFRLDEIGRIFSVTKLSGWGYGLLFVPALIVFIVFEVYKSYRDHRDRSKKKK